ncbi:hypothetical protein [Microbacterium thalli]|uniref:hypothetical protein n=1 Tax=Microbacterium thalli TaxID=3027921 RepID=UPI0023659B61|nr:hypothetical protein [Microbacterium thalli]MDD7928409.1 hypothetical protein [Microbacterium thalli]
MTTATSRRPLIILGIVAGVLLIAALVVFLLMQRGVQPTAAPSSLSPTASASATPTATPTPAPTPTSTPTDVQPQAAEVVMAATGFTIVADDGSTLLEFRWRDEVEPAVAALAAAFGEEPELGVHPGDGSHFPDYTMYDWAGFTLYDMIVADERVPRDSFGIPSWASLRANEVSGVALRPEFGLAIGMDVDSVRATGPEQESDLREHGDGLHFAFDIGRTSPWPEEGSTEDYTYSVFANTDEAATEVTEITYRPYSWL